MYLDNTTFSRAERADCTSPGHASKTSRLYITEATGTVGTAGTTTPLRLAYHLDAYVEIELLAPRVDCAAT